MKTFQWAAYVVVSLIGAAAPFHCEAGRPLATEDADILDKADCEWEGAYARQKANRSSRGVALLGKTGLIERKDDGIGLTVAWTIGGVKDPGNAFKHDFTQLNLVATQEVLTGVTWHANLGWLRNQIDHKNFATWNLAGEYAVGGGVDVVGEFYGEEHSKPWWGIGTRWQATETLSVNTGFGMQSERPRIREWTVGFKYAF